MVFHVLNRGVGRMRLFDKEQDYAAFERILEETLAVRPMRLCCYCVMPTIGTRFSSPGTMATWRPSRSG